MTNDKKIYLLSFSVWLNLFFFCFTSLHVLLMFRVVLGGIYLFDVREQMFRCDEGLMRSKIRRSISEKRRNQNKVPQTLFQAWVQKSSLSNYSDKNYEIWNLIDLKCLSFLKQVLWKFKMKRVPGTIIWRFRPKKFVRLTNFVKKITNNYTFSSLVTVQYCQVSFIR